MLKSFQAWSKRIRRFIADARGVAAIEMALVFPFVVIIYFGMVDITDMLAANRRVTTAASTLADLVTQAPGEVKKVDLMGFYNAVQPIMDPYPAEKVSINLFGYRKDGGAPKLKWQHARGGSCGPVSTADFMGLMEDGNDLVVASVCVDFEPLTGRIISDGPYRLADQLVLRPRQSATIDCTDC